MALFQLSPGQYRGCVRFFNQNSVNGRLGAAELEGILMKHNIHTDNNHLNAMIRCISIDPSGIGLQAFLDYMATHQDFRDQDSEYAECFRTFDRTASGKINRTEIKYVMAKLGNAKIDLDELLDEVDTNRDGQIDYDEFVVMMKKR